MRLGRREKQILLALTKFRFARARDFASLIQQAKWPLESEKVRFPKRRVVISSVCRSLRLLEQGGYVENTRHERRRDFSWVEGSGQPRWHRKVKIWYSHPEWHLTKKGQIAVANLKMHLKDRLERQIQEVAELRKALS
jgi:hypothetical protein